MAFTYTWPGTIADSAIDPDSPIDTALMTAIRNALVFNYEYIGGKSYTPAEPHTHNGTDSALVTSVANGAITQAKIASAAVGQAQLKTASGAVSAFGSTPSLLTLPGGDYGFYPQIKVQDSSAGNSGFTIAGDMNGSVWSNSLIGTSYATRIAVYNTRGTNDTSFAQQRYIQASPPYEPYRANDAVPLFVFALLDKTTGAVRATYVAADPPWANNGPTVINPRGLLMAFLKQKLAADPGDEIDRLDALDSYLKDPANAGEIAGVVSRKFSQAEKNADMVLIPHPFGSFDPAKHVVTVIHPTDDKFGRGLLMRHEYLGDSLSEMLHSGKFILDNTPLPGLATPAGVMAVRARAKLTK